jgi:hypothetical protein
MIRLAGKAETGLTVAGFGIELPGIFPTLAG